MTFIPCFSLIRSCFKDVSFWGHLKATALLREEECFFFFLQSMNQVRMFQKIMSRKLSKETLSHTQAEPFYVAPVSKKDLTKHKIRRLFTVFTTVSCLLFTQEYTNREDKGRDLESEKMCQWWMRVCWVCTFYCYLLKPKTYTVIAHFTLLFLYIQCTFLIMKSDSCIAFIEESSFMYMTMSADLVRVCIYSKSTRVKSAITSICCHQFQWW